MTTETRKYALNGLLDKTLICKLAKIQKELKAPKSQFNKFGNYKYRNCEDILEAVKPLLGDCIILLSDKVVKIGDRYYIKADAIFKDDSGDVISVTAYARESLDKKGMDVSQITGASSSYARKYALNGLLAIDDTKDADTKDNTKVIDDKLEEAIDNFPADIKKGCEFCGATGKYHKPGCPNNRRDI